MPNRKALMLAGLLVVGLGPAAEAAGARRIVSAPAKKDAGKWIGTRPIAVASGEVRMPSPGEATDLAASLKGMLDRSGAGTSMATRPDGTRQLNLESLFGSVVLTRPTEDGGVETRCVTTFEEATSFLGLAPAEVQ
jgi:hypothetical protein